MDQPTSPQVQHRIRLIVDGGADLRDRYANNFVTGGMFIPQKSPAPINSHVLIDVVLPNDKLICRLLAEVIRSKPPLTKDDPTAGIGIRFVKMDESGRRLVDHFRKASPGEPRPARIRPRALEASGPIVGIDLGTMNTCVAVVRNGEPTVLANHRGYDTLPSVVHYDDDGKPVAVGHSALERMVIAPFNAVYGSKRFIGRAYRSTEVQALGHFFNYSLVENRDGYAAAQIGAHRIPLVEVAGHILREVVDIATRALGEPVQRAVVTVPAYFGESQRAATVAAAELAGLHIEQLINEPTAAAIAFGMLKPGTQATVLTYDLGGGTFDASLLRIEGRKMQVLASEGDPFLGGTDFDDRLIQNVLLDVERRQKLDLRSDPVAIQRIRMAAEAAKKELSEASEAQVKVPFIAEREGRRIDLNVTITRDTFVTLTSDLLDRTLSIVQRVLDTAGVKTEDIDELILAGGQTRSPHVAKRVRERFGKAPSKRIHPDHAVAIGAAVVADRLTARPPPPKKAPPPLPPRKKPAAPSPQPDRSNPASLPASHPVSSPAPMAPLSEELTLDLSTQSVADDFDLREIVSTSLHVMLPDGTARALFPRKTPLPAERDVFIAPTARSPTEYIVVLVRGEHTRPELNEPICSVRPSREMALGLAGAKVRIWIRVNIDGQLDIVAENPMTGESERLDVPVL